MAPAAPAGAVIADEEAYNAWRLTLGVPDAAKDSPFEADYPIEANFDLLSGIDFQKGCFVGQETTSRMKRRGMIKSRMVGLAYEGADPVFGAEILAGDLRAGEVRTAKAGRAIALVRLDRIDGAALTVDRPSGPGAEPKLYKNKGRKHDGPYHLGLRRLYARARGRRWPRSRRQDGGHHRRRHRQSGSRRRGLWPNRAPRLSWRCAITQPATRRSPRSTRPPRVRKRASSIWTCRAWRR